MSILIFGGDYKMNMKKRNLFMLTMVFIVGMFSFMKLATANHNFTFRTNALVTLQKTIDFEDLDYGNMSATAHNSYYGGVIVADGRITRTSTAKIDNNSLGMRIPVSTTDSPRVAIIQVSGYTKIVLDLKQSRTYTKISTGCSQLFVSSTNGQILRDIEIPTYGYHEITLTFFTETSIASTMDCGIDNIRFYGIGPAEGSPDSSSGSNTDVTSSMGETSLPSEGSTENQPITAEISMRNIANFLEDKNEHYPLSDEFIETYQQASGGYIDLAKRLGMIVDKSKHEPNQKWHFFDSWMYPSIEAGTLSWEDDAKNRVYTRLLCPELLLWIYEATEVPTTKIVNAKIAAEEGKVAGLHISTIAKNMRSCVPWEDIRYTLLNHMAANS